MHLPKDFVEEIKPLIADEWTAFEKALSEDSPTSIRLNPAKNFFANDLEPVLWSKNGYYLAERPSFTFDPIFHTGAYYVQEASSMFIEQVFEQYVGDSDVNVLDLCAAPGGKSTHIASLISNKSLLVSNEVIRSRASILSENITKAGYPNTIVVNNDPSEIGKSMKGFFDIILVDAPCSGEGMFRKDANAMNEWSLSNVKLCKERQQRILADIWDALKPGGLLIYSTCTYNVAENEENITWIRDTLSADVLPIELKSAWNIHGTFDGFDVPVYHFMPHRNKGEGFCLALLRKVDTGEANTHRFSNNKKKGNSNKSKLKNDSFKSYLRNPNEFIFFDKGTVYFAFPSSLHDCFEQIVSNLRLVSAGICLGEQKGKDFIPHQSLALSLALNKDAFDLCEIDKPTAISFLRKEPLLLTDYPKGYLLLTYKNTPLGFVKNLGNRANNLYPNEWRIRSQSNDYL